MPSQRFWDGLDYSEQAERQVLKKLYFLSSFLTFKELPNGTSKKFSFKM